LKRYVFKNAVRFICQPLCGIKLTAMEDSLKKEIDKINLHIQQNYSSIHHIYINEYNYPELDSVRDEICKCIIFGLNQAAITLTNHLLESALKKCLIYNYTIKNKQLGKNDLEEIFKEGISKYDNEKSDLSKSINAACTNGLITKKQKSILHHFREKYRNSYSHASSQKTFGNLKIPGKLISSVNETFKPTENNLTVTDIPIIQGIVQSIIASNDSLPYFNSVDEIIRDVLNKLNQKK